MRQVGWEAFDEQADTRGHAGLATRQGRRGGGTGPGGLIHSHNSTMGPLTPEVSRPIALELTAQPLLPA